MLIGLTQGCSSSGDNRGPVVGGSERALRSDLRWLPAWEHRRYPDCSSRASVPASPCRGAPGRVPVFGVGGIYPPEEQLLLVGPPFDMLQARS